MGISDSMKTLEVIEKIVVKSFCELNTEHLNMLYESPSYNHNDKQEFIEELSQIIYNFKSKGIYGLTVKPSTCKFCYPSASAYSFHHPVTDEFIFRYVFHQESETFFRVEECKNIPPRADDMPF